MMTDILEAPRIQHVEYVPIPCDKLPRIVPLESREVAAKVSRASARYEIQRRLTDVPAILRQLLRLLRQPGHLTPLTIPCEL